MSEESAASPRLVDPAISAAKLARQLQHWEQNRAIYEERGWMLLDVGELHVEVAFAARVPIAPHNDVPLLPLGARFDFDNYDLWPPSVKLIDPLTRRWLAMPRLGAIEFLTDKVPPQLLNVFVAPHPETGKVFLCKRGVREYHRHPEHCGDDWLLYRDQGVGTLAQLCDVLWRLTTNTVTGFNFVAQRIAAGQVAQVNLGVELRQEDVDPLEAQLQAQLPQVLTGAVPAQLAAQLPPHLQALFAQGQQGQQGQQ